MAVPGGAAEVLEPLPGAKMASALLIDTLHALNDTVRYCVLRGSDGEAAGTPHADVDLLVDARDLPGLRRIVSKLGFAPLASWGHGGHRFFMAFEEASGHWLKLDVVTSLRYGGPNRALAPRALAGCLDRRQFLNAVWRPDVVDDLLGLVLHALLDKGAFKDGHRREIGRLRDLVEADDGMRAAARERFRAALGAVLPWDQASEAIVLGAWESLLARRRQIAWGLFRRAPLGSARRWLGGEMARALRPFLVAFGPAPKRRRSGGRNP